MTAIIEMPIATDCLVYPMATTVIKYGTFLMASGWVMLLIMIGALISQKKESNLD